MYNSFVKQLYNIAIVFYLIEGVLAKSFYRLLLPDVFFKGCILLSIFLLFSFIIIDMNNKRVKKSQFLIIILSFLFLGIFYWRLGMKVALFFVFIIFGRNIKFDQSAKTVMITLVILLSLVVVSSKIGIIENYSVIERGQTREFLGFYYMLYPMSLMASVTFLYAYIYRREIKIKWLLMLTVANVYLFHLTGARLSFACSAVTLLFALWIRKKNIYTVFRKKKKLRVVMCLSLVIATLISALLVFAYSFNIEFMNVINKAAEERIALTLTSLKLYGINLFGQSIEWIGNGLGKDGEAVTGDYLYVDNFYFNYLQRLGLIPYLFLMTVITLTLFKANKNNDIWLLCLCSIEAIHGIVDDGVFSMRYFPFWLICGNYIYSERAFVDKQLENIDAMIRHIIRRREKRKNF